MRSLVVANVEMVEASPFLVAILYDADGEYADEILMPYEDATGAISRIRILAEEYGVSAPELWTSTRELFGETLSMTGVFGRIKHGSDTVETKRVIKRDSEVLYDLYEIQPVEELPKPSRFRAFLIKLVTKIQNKLTEGYNYEI